MGFQIAALFCRLVPFGTGYIRYIAFVLWVVWVLCPHLRSNGANPPSSACFRPVLRECRFAAAFWLSPFAVHHVVPWASHKLCAGLLVHDPFFVVDWKLIPLLEGVPTTALCRRRHVQGLEGCCAQSVVALQTLWFYVGCASASILASCPACSCAELSTLHGQDAVLVRAPICQRRCLVLICRSRFCTWAAAARHGACNHAAASWN